VVEANLYPLRKANIDALSIGVLFLWDTRLIYDGS
jgi:hypothetical protein